MAGDGMSSPGSSDDPVEKTTRLQSQIVSLHEGIGFQKWVLGALQVQKIHNDWIIDKEKSLFSQGELSYSVPLYRIFDQILLLVADNRNRGMTLLSVDVDQNKGRIRFTCTGTSITMGREAMLQFTKYSSTMKFNGVFANALSKRFTVRTTNGKKVVKQTYKESMSKVRRQVAKNRRVPNESTHLEEWTSVSFTPDLEILGMAKLEGDIISMMRKRVIEMTCTIGKNIEVYFNDELIPEMTFLNYVEHYIGADAEAKDKHPRVYENVGEWEICLTLSDGEFNQVSFMNGHSTVGGSHVDCVADQVIAYVMRNIEESGKHKEIKHENVKSWLWLFVNVTNENATFDSPCKETVTNSKDTFTCRLSDEFLKKFIEFGIITKPCPMGDLTTEPDLSDSDVIRIPKLDDAKFAGGTKARECTLILTEGDSAKLFVMYGLSTIGRDYYGVYPLKGKIMNVHGREPEQAWNSYKVRTIMQIMGLEFERNYSVVDGVVDGLRYGHIMLMMDQDVDGSHIKVLIINLFLRFWPSLLRVEGFLQQFITPVIRLSRNSESTPLLFYSMIEYKLWNERQEGEAGNWTVKYCKGLGTNSVADAAKYFQNMREHTRNFIWRGEEDRDSINLAFKKSTTLRKEWMKIGFEFQSHIDYNQESISYSDFIDKELRLYSIAHLERSTPSLMDGFKPVQRKIIHSCFKRILKEVKVTELVGYVLQDSAYLHGDQSLPPAIIGMAQDFVGTNNINLLQPKGQYGTRSKGKKHAAKSRYISTGLSDMTEKVFPKQDEVHLNYLKQDGKEVEAEWYAPVVPMILINGCSGVGTGWRTSVPKYNPLDVANLMRKLIINAPLVEPLIELVPWYRGFKDISVEGDAKNVDITVTLTEENMQKTDDQDPLILFKLTTIILTNNMNLYDSDGRFTNYATPNKIAQEFYKIRFPLYEKRKEAIIKGFTIRIKQRANKIKFIRGFQSGEYILTDKENEDQMLGYLKEKGFEAIPEEGDAIGFKYLSSLQISQLTDQYVSELVSEKQIIEAECEAIAMKQPSELWLADLDNFEKAARELYAAEEDTEKAITDANASAMDVDGKDVPELLSGGPISPEHRELEREGNTKRKQPKKDRRRERKKSKKDRRRERKKTEEG